jgi:2-aminoadipate transaminase
MKIPIDRNSSMPIYRQIEQSLQLQIESGALSPGTKLPASRKLAEMLGVSRIVVANAYEQLELKGLVFSRTGSGTFVAKVSSNAQPIEISGRIPGFPFWQQELLSRSWKSNHQNVAILLNNIAHSDMISFAERLSEDEIWPVDDLRRSVHRVFQFEDLAALNQSGVGVEGFSGLLSLKLAIAKSLTGEGIPAAVEEIVVTSGVQQAIYLVARTLLKPGDQIIIENPTSYMAIDLFRSLDTRLISIDVDENGMQVDRLEDVLRALHPKLIYLSPTFQNPTGTRLSGERRVRLMMLADENHIPILEDDSFGHLCFDGREKPSLKALDPGGRVIYTGDFSTLLVPGIRVGYLAVSGPIHSHLMAEKYVSDLSTSELLQRTVCEYLNSGRYQPYLRKVSMVYRQRRDTMIEALARYFPEEIQWNAPSGGVYLWLCLPEGHSSYDLFRFAAMEGVTFVPGRFFFSGESPDNYLRLDFSINSAERISDGIQRLATAYKRYIQTIEYKTSRGSFGSK